MPRIEKLKPEELSPEQQRIARDIAATRKRGVGGPFAIWLRNPPLADAANRLGNALRASGKLDKRLFELTVLLVARHWSARYAWWVHESAARDAGVAPELIAAIREQRRPARMRADEQLIYEVVSELNETKAISAPTYDRAVAALGTDLMIELVSVAGFYTMVAVMLNGFDVPAPDGEPALT